MTIIRIATLLLGFALAASAARAACDVSKPRDQITHEDAQAVYDCLKDSMLEGYLTGDKRWIPEEFVRNYRSWTPASRLPADPGVHGERFLLTYVNEIGAADYLKFAEEGAKMPAGTVIGKESFAIGQDGKAAAGPLFLMQKVADGVSPATGDWYFMAVAPDGAPMAVDVMTACNQCHSAFEGQDRLGYPVPEVRVGG